MLLNESARCRDILASLAGQPEGDGGAPFSRLPLSALAEAAAAPFAPENVTIEVTRAPRDDSAEPEVVRKPEILHGVGTLVENATRFASARVTLNVAWDAREARIAIRDDGPGFAEGVLPFLGEPYLSSQAQGDGQHMGLGVFIARTLLARTGAAVAFANRAGGGAEVVITWPRAHLEEQGPGTGRSEEERAR
jgi:two-component system sensor histidine kinase RegB